MALEVIHPVGMWGVRVSLRVSLFQHRNVKVFSFRDEFL
jgi:hypothetical protein